MRCHGRNTEGYLHGRASRALDYDYSTDELEEIAGRVRALDSDAEQVHVMFNNNARELAPKAARALRTILGQDPGPEPYQSSRTEKVRKRTGEATPGG
jgi:uncharacterized protein YecE (DUF72 family)